MSIGTDYCAPDVQHLALITIDVQRDFYEDGSPTAVQGTLDCLPKMSEVVNLCRSSRIPIIHVVRLYLADGSNVDLVRRANIDAGASIVRPNSKGSEIAPDLLPDPAKRLEPELLLQGRLQVLGPYEWAMYKPRWGAFYSTNLMTHLESLQVNTIMILGCNFPNCPRTTIYEASERDYRIVLIEDAMSGVYDNGIAECRNIGAVVSNSLGVHRWIAGECDSP